MEGRDKKVVISKMEFHISKQSRDKYQFDDELLSLSGNVIFAGFHNARLFAQKINDKKDLVNYPEEAVKAGQIHAMGLIDEILHLVVSLYREQKNFLVTKQAYDWLIERIGRQTVDEALLLFTYNFPPLSVYRDEFNVETYLNADTIRVNSEGEKVNVSNKEIALEEMLMLWLENNNPAFYTFLELFDDTELEKNSPYREIIDNLYQFFEIQPTFGPSSQNLIDMLRSPALAVPHSLPGQLEYIREHWGFLLGRFLYRILSSLDLIKEEEKAIFTGSGPAIPYDFSTLEIEKEHFTPDRDWMPSVVLIAKNAYVWLDQLSKRYQRQLKRLDEIPDKELDQFAQNGINGLWLIGLWERSPASKRIKQMRGKPDAEASAYSIFNYQIASDLGGEEAYENLRDRAWKRGIRLASDMVPNHMGIDSKWVIEHPNRFISLDYSPFPTYTFNGPNLSWDERVGIFLEDHYYDSSDAAVVFKRVDYHTGDSRYIYHGNDGTSMPWNDTAQLNYLLPEVRDSIIEEILSVARRFPIIRFDAAMTLAKKHYQRLWFPQPGSGGAIPTRSDHGLSKSEFDVSMPKEFWREVVDTIAREAPDTLLLAEAFWLMEGYFVRTLGMHRVYNSAFMNMLRDEKNQDYRLVIKNTLEFDPEILKRYVNFMSNPDEETAVAQFGKGDKYFGICIMMATMPGLPMFGHGQIEGFAEKYGMEFRRAYWEETSDLFLMERHEREIFPLLHKRYLFAEVKEFLLYDFFTPGGEVNEDVFVYTNRSGTERTMVIYHNRFAHTSGWIRSSVSFAVKHDVSDEWVLMQKTLGEGLGLVQDHDHFCIFRDHITGMEYIHRNKDIHEQGLYIELNAYESRVIMDFKQVQDDRYRRYAHLEELLNGRGVPSIDEALRELVLQPVQVSFRSLISSNSITLFMENCGKEIEGQDDYKFLDEVEGSYTQFLGEVGAIVENRNDESTIRSMVQEVRSMLEAICGIPQLRPIGDTPASAEYSQATKMLKEHLDCEAIVWGTLLAYIYIHPLGKLVEEEQSVERSRSWVDEFLFGRVIARSIQELGESENGSWRSVQIVKSLISHARWPYCLGLVDKIDSEIKPMSLKSLLQDWLSDIEIQRFVQINRYQGILWFNKESLEDFLEWMLISGCLEIMTDDNVNSSDIDMYIIKLYEIIERLRSASDTSGYKVEGLLEAIE
jgi:glycosidase